MMRHKLAELIVGLRTEYPIHSWRRIAEVICELHPLYIEEKYGDGAPKDLHGNQMLGDELVRDACTVLGLKYEDIENEVERKLK